MKTRALLLAGTLVFSAALSQAGSHKPLFVSPDFNPALIDRIDVFLPDPGDAASHAGKCIAGVQFGDPLQLDGGADWSLLKRGYNSHFKDYNKVGPRKTLYYTLPIALSDAMLSNPSKEWLQDLANRKYFVKSKEEPPPGRWIMIITIDELGAGPGTPKGQGRATLSMYLYDREQATLLWHDQETEKLQGSLGESLMGKAWGEQAVCENLTNSMVLNLPKHKD